MAAGNGSLRCVVQCAWGLVENCMVLFIEEKG